MTMPATIASKKGLVLAGNLWFWSGVVT